MRTKIEAVPILKEVWTRCRREVRVLNMGTYAGEQLPTPEEQKLAGQRIHKFCKEFCESGLGLGSCMAKKLGAERVSKAIYEEAQENSQI